MKYKLKAILLTLVLSIGINLYAGEGMWIPVLLKLLNESEMQAMGMRISAEDIYSINHSSMKDAIVRFGRGCTGVVVSEQGLLLTNHHCGLGAIQSHSSLEHDYLTDGFWAWDKLEELPNQGLTVTFIVRIENVTQKILEGVDEGMTEAERDDVISAKRDELIEEAVKDTHYDAVIRPFYYGNEYYLFITETYKDIRLVGAPPSNIGKFGGDTDNWMWPRHTGDFSIFRIYADSNNNPAEYSPDNIPYTPKYKMPISIAGIEEGDFTMVFGFPGSTQEYLPSYAIENITGKENPAIISLRQQKIDIYNEAMKKDDLVRIQYSSKLARVANYWKKMIGENRGIKKIDAVAKKQELETKFQEWADSDPELKKQYGQLLPEFKKIYCDLAPLELARTYVFECGLGIELVNFAGSFRRLVEESATQGILDADIERLKTRYQSIANNHFKNYHRPIDRKVFRQLISMYAENLTAEYKPAIFEVILAKFGNDFSKYRDYVFENSIFADRDRTLDFLKKYKKNKYKKIIQDPAYEIYSSIRNFYNDNLGLPLQYYYKELDSLQRIYMKGLMEFESEKRFYPDANSTLRVHYGNVDDYYPRDGVHYDYFTTLDGIMEKENPDIYDYVVEEKLKELYNSKDYGRYADKDGSMHVCFTGSNHTTGGNSGSPVFNADGQLIGLNFDRNWEGTMSDLMYDPDQCRNITLDVRYLLFIVDKYAGAGHLVDEMTIVE